MSLIGKIVGEIYSECCFCGKRYKHVKHAGLLVEHACPKCAAKIPQSLIKACFDPFFYALGLTSGKVIEFVEADIWGEWVTLRGWSDDHGDNPFEKPFCGYMFHRGIDIRLDSIVWCADAPNGS